tara:strand:- start:36865 stop:38241 length:1377 start_codon:yes stop_codon:yes gene_type:complete
MASIKGRSGQGYLDARDNLVGDLESEWHTALRDAVLAGWSLGYESRGQAAAGTLSVDEIFTLAPHLRTQLQRYFQYASRFAHELSDGIPDAKGRMPFGVRSEQYARAINGAYTQGAVDGGAPGEQIIWALGSNERSCGDCPALAAISMETPFTRETLPTTPGQGETECLHNCRCHLIFLRGPKQPELIPQIYDQITSEGDPPPGKRRPTDTEKGVVQDLQFRMNYARRMMAEVDPGSTEFRNWTTTRQRLNKQLIDYTESKKIKVVPEFSVSEVISGQQVSPDDVRKILTRGIDGRTIHMIDAQSIDTEIAKAEAQLRELLEGIQASPELPLVPNISIRDTQNESIYLSNDEPFGIKSIDPSKEFSPDPTGQWTVNVSGIGIKTTLETHLKILRLLADVETPYFLTVGPYTGDGWIDLVRFTGTWIKGPAEEVQRLMVDAREAFGIKSTGYAPFLQGV